MTLTKCPHTFMTFHFVPLFVHIHIIFQLLLLRAIVIRKRSARKKKHTRTPIFRCVLFVSHFACMELAHYMREYWLEYFAIGHNHSKWSQLCYAYELPINGCYHLKFTLRIVQNARVKHIHKENIYIKISKCGYFVFDLECMIFENWQTHTAYISYVEKHCVPPFYRNLNIRNWLMLLLLLLLLLNILVTATGLRWFYYAAIELFRYVVTSTEQSKINTFLGGKSISYFKNTHIQYVNTF